MSSSYDLVVINGIVVTALDIGAYDIAIKDEKIALLAPRGGLRGIESNTVIDAEGGWVMVCLEALWNPCLRISCHRSWCLHQVHGISIDLSCSSQAV